MALRHLLLIALLVLQPAWSAAVAAPCATETAGVAACCCGGGCCAADGPSACGCRDSKPAPGDPATPVELTPAPPALAISHVALLPAPALVATRGSATPQRRPASRNRVQAILGVWRT